MLFIRDCQEPRAIAVIQDLREAPVPQEREANMVKVVNRAEE